ncbi:hypothetical protein [Corynebacterium hindlerae]|uniref:hypothetical protein n=1 Tax=Corynebacterium hindlerae TaxID=699041 RepID=UPI003AAEA17A
MTAFFESDLAGWVGRHGVSLKDLRMGELAADVRAACDPAVLARDNATLRDILAGGVGESRTARALPAYLRRGAYGVRLPHFGETDDYVPAGLLVALSPSITWAAWQDFARQAEGKLDEHLRSVRGREEASHRDFDVVGFLVSALTELGVPVDLWNRRAWQQLTGGLGLDRTWRLLEDYAKTPVALGVLRRVNDRAEGVDTGDMVTPGFDVDTDELGALSGGSFPDWKSQR